MTEMVALLVRWYGVNEHTARELIADLRDTRSLQSLAGLPQVERAVPR